MAKRLVSFRLSDEVMCNLDNLVSLLDWKAAVDGFGWITNNRTTAVEKAIGQLYGQLEKAKHEYEKAPRGRRHGLP
ncbi:MAG TPA: hypothetical protein VKT80_11215 [Chloroflexota bacterium]|nr:hypothetical protein [Chloroflexota bacterium]